MADGLLAVTLAGDCAACGLPLDAPLAGPVCEACWRAVQVFSPPWCPRCGTPSASGAATCRVCRRRASPLAAARAAGPYDGALRAILHAFKYDRRRSLARPLAALLRQAGREVLEGADACVPVPLHWWRRWQRGFNQADELARHLGLPVRRALRRTRHTRVQATLQARERAANVRGAFRTRGRAPLHGARLVLVDDVATTGATLDACARALLEAGAREVRALTVARVAVSNDRGCRT